MDIKIRNHVNGSTCRVLKESLKFLHNFLPELFVCFHHVSTSFRDELKDLCIGHRRLNETLLHNLREDQKWDDEVLAWGKTKRLQSAHKSKKRLVLVLGNFPVLLE